MSPGFIHTETHTYTAAQSNAVCCFVMSNSRVHPPPAVTSVCIYCVVVYVWSSAHAGCYLNQLLQPRSFLPVYKSDEFQGFCLGCEYFCQVCLCVAACVCIFVQLTASVLKSKHFDTASFTDKVLELLMAPMARRPGFCYYYNAVLPSWQFCSLCAQ